MNGSQNSRHHFLPRCPQYWRPSATFQNTHTIKSADDRSVGGLISCTDETEYRIEVERRGPGAYWYWLKWSEKLSRYTSSPCPALEDPLRNLCSRSFIDPFSCIVDNICQSACLFKSYLWSRKMTVTVTVIFRFGFGNLDWDLTFSLFIYWILLHILFHVSKFLSLVVHLIWKMCGKSFYIWGRHTTVSPSSGRNFWTRRQKGLLTGRQHWCDLVRTVSYRHPAQKLAGQSVCCVLVLVTLWILLLGSAAVVRGSRFQLFSFPLWLYLKFQWTDPHPRPLSKPAWF